MVKFINRPPSSSGSGRAVQKAAERQAQQLSTYQSRPLGSPVTPTGRIPNASIIYGLAAAGLFAVSIYFIITLAQWFTGLLILSLAATLLGYALHYMKYR